MVARFTEVPPSFDTRIYSGAKSALASAEHAAAHAGARVASAWGASAGWAETAARALEASLFTKQAAGLVVALCVATLAAWAAVLRREAAACMRETQKME